MINRKEFLKIGGLAGAGLAGAGMMTGCSDSGRNRTGEERLNHIREQAETPRAGQFNMHGYAAPPLDIVRVGITGIGNRGSGTVRRLASIEGVEIKALSDLEEDRVNRAIETISDRHTPDGYFGGEDEWKRMCERDDIDLIAIATPWHLHTDQAVYAMEHGKHVYTELPAADTVEDCWRLVETSERTRRHCVQMSASCHYPNYSVLLNMIRHGVFGELITAEGAYVHDLLSDYNFTKHMYHNMWRLKENIGRHGNLYPQHGIVPLMQMFGITSGDQFDYMTSMSTDDFMMGKKAEERAAEDEFWEPYVGRDYRGNMNNSTIRTKNGKVILLQHDVTSPRPRIFKRLVSGTKGAYAGTPDRFAFGHEFVTEEEFDALVEEYTPAMTRAFQEFEKEATLGQGLSSYERVNMQDWRLIDCLRNGLPVEMDVYEAATSSVITPLSEWSVANKSAPIDIPDFTNGAWESNGQGMNVNLETGGGSTGLV